VDHNRSVLKKEKSIMSKVYRAAVIGAGSGGKLSIAALAASPHYELAAVADLSATARGQVESLYPTVQTFATHGELFATVPVDVVCVSTWPPSHLQVTSDALQLPLTGILVEKPLGDTVQAGASILAQVQAKELPLAVPHGLLVADHSRQILERVRSGEIGELKLVEIQCSGWDIINAGIHWLNYFVMLTGQEPVEYVMACIDATTRTYRDGMQVETLAVTYAQTQGGVRVVMQTGDFVQTSEAGKQILFRLVGSGGSIDFYGWEPRYRILNHAHPSGKAVEVTPGPRSNHQRHLDQLAHEMDQGKPDYAIAKSSLAALELCEAAYLSGRLGCPVQLPLSAFTPPAPVAWTPGRPYSGQGGGRDGRKL
jgi:predicted dehydrogenase